MHTLISFLGRVSRDEKGQYRKTPYLFPDGDTADPAAFFGYVLARRLRPDRLVILGTAGSMWDHLFEGDLDLGIESEAEREALITSVESRSVTQTQLDTMAPALSRSLEIDVRLQLIPDCFDEAEQLHLLATMAQQVDRDASLDLDVTHGFRHLPMLSLLAAIYLRSIRRAKISGIWYAAFNPDAGSARVMRLDGLLRIQEWIEAMARFDASGNYGGFSDLLVQDGLPDDKAKCLQRAHYLEQVLNVPDAANNVRTVLKALEQPLGGAAELFRSQLVEGLRWARPSAQELADQQASLARQALGRGDFLRAAIFGNEAFVTRLCLEARRDPKDYAQRKDVYIQFEEGLNNSPGEAKSTAYWRLKNLRNAMAHGTQPKDEADRQTLRSPERLRACLLESLNQLQQKGGKLAE